MWLSPEPTGGREGPHGRVKGAAPVFPRIPLCYEPPIGDELRQSAPKSRGAAPDVPIEAQQLPRARELARMLDDYRFVDLPPPAVPLREFPKSDGGGVHPAQNGTPSVNPRREGGLA